MGLQGLENFTMSEAVIIARKLHESQNLAGFKPLEDIRARLVSEKLYNFKYP